MKHSLFVFVSAWLTTGAALSAAETPARPNLILCMADDQGWGDMAYNGHPRVQTPVFDQMAHTGLRLDRFYAAPSASSPAFAGELSRRRPLGPGYAAPLAHAPRRRES
jgi:hypothetical protein